MITAAALIEILEGLDPETEVRIATQPFWPFDNTLTDRYVTLDHLMDVDPSRIDTEGHPVVWLGIGDQLAYLDGDVAEALGWK